MYRNCVNNEGLSNAYLSHHFMVKCSLEICSKKSLSSSENHLSKSVRKTEAKGLINMGDFWVRYATSFDYMDLGNGNNVWIGLISHRAY